ncbi:MAG: tryptophan synthase subunit alpha [Methanosarcinales archaeon]|nr:tryptophan synthase subunit alpha [Methanosarcinales archaeon]
MSQNVIDVEANTRISDAFHKGPALIAYICAGDPTIEATKDIVRSLVKGGADIIELGLPFSDPVADGPTIQAAIERALDSGMNPDKYFEMAAELDVNVPLVCMTYYNLIFKRGLERFVKDSIASGITGLIVPDLPPEESGDLAAVCKEYGMDLIFLIAPTTPPKRIKMISKKSSGFIYLVARLGVTGARTDVADMTTGLISKVNKEAVEGCNTPLAVGFGVSKGEHAKQFISAGANGVIVGSAFIDIIASGNDVNAKVEALARELKEGVKDGTKSR